MMRTNHLSAGQRLQIQGVARTLRDPAIFIATVMDTLGARRWQPTNAEVDSAIANALSDGGCRYSLTDAASPTKKGKTMTTTNATRKYRRLSWDDPAAWNDDGILKDGVVVSVPVSLADARMPEVFAAAQASRSGQYNRPGWRQALQQDAAAADARQLAYDQHRHYIENAYRGDNLVGGGSDRVKADAAMTHDTREAAYAAKGEYDALPAHAARDGRTHQQVMAEIYRLRDEETSNAWRTATE